ncbi:MAG: DEAD/DEAH box helicase [Planctomycetes bacterium]|nr:DEAD/DEAH box helicase [Planctomycetota bacterium]
MPFKTLIQPLLRAVQSEGYTTPTAIQTLAIPHVLEGKDLLGCAQTGTGKTAAFALPILQRLHRQDAPKQDARGKGGKGGRARPIRSLVLTPTRELAAQVGESFGTYGRHSGLRHAVVFGGVSQRGQVEALRGGVDVLVATPGRLLDLMGQKLLSLEHVEIFVLDEADRMLDMGFIHDIRRVIAHLPPRRQTLLFSATMPREIRSLADAVMTDPVHVAVPAESPAADTVDQAVYHVPKAGKIDLLLHLLENPRMDRTLVFTRTKHGADKVVRRLVKAEIAAEAIHSNKSQNARVRALENFRRGKTRILVASDIAARGLDVDGITHVVNFDLPHEPETYVHRIGRTGRAGASGEAVSFCCDDERDDLRQIERLLGRAIPVRSHSIKCAVTASTAEARPKQAASARTRTSTAPKSGSQQPRRAGATGETQKREFWRHRRRRKASSPGAGRSRRRGA